MDHVYVYTCTILYCSVNDLLVKRSFLIVVAVIAVLVAVSIPIFTTQLHKSRVAADWANVRAYFGEIQADYMTTGEMNPKVPADEGDAFPDFDWKTITFLDGQKVELKTGHYGIHFDKDTGYSIEYDCIKGHTDCHLSLPVK